MQLPAQRLSVWFRGANLLCKSPRLTEALANATIDGCTLCKGQIGRTAKHMSLAGAVMFGEETARIESGSKHLWRVEKGLTNGDL